MNLTRPQLAALEHFSKSARSRKEDAQASIKHILKMSNISEELFSNAVENIKSSAPVALHFHPDRLDTNMSSVAKDLFETGIYKSQFETQLSNGGVTAHPGGARDLWEQQIFGGAYTFETSENSERPKYGALDILRHSDGPAPRFGSCYFHLKPAVSKRCTFTYLDSNQNPDEKGTIEEFDDILAALLIEVFVRDFALGEKELTPTRLINLLLNNLRTDFTAAPKRNLNHYIEAQIHGEIELGRDALRLIADPSFKNTPTGDLLKNICDKYELTLNWHNGFALSIDQIPTDFRGPTMPSLAQRISSKNYVDVNLIGQTDLSLKQDPTKWSDRGDYKEVLQELKLLWHVLVKYGKPLQKF
jgi:hypothetical protein